MQTKEIKLNRFENLLAYISPQYIGKYKGKEIFLGRNLEYSELYYQDILMEDTSTYQNHICEFVSCGVQIYKGQKENFIQILKDIDFKFPENMEPLSKCNIGPGRINKMFHQLYYTNI